MPTAAAKTRDPWFDNAKMALVLLVVVGPLVDAAAAHHAQRPPLRLPLRLARAGVRPRHRLPVALLHLRAPAAVAAGPHRRGPLRGLRVRRWRCSGSTSAASSSRTCSATRTGRCGTSSALFFWRLLTPVFTRMPAGVAIAVAVAVSLVAGLYAGDTLDMARVLGLLPFFVLGPDRHPGAARAAARAVGPERRAAGLPGDRSGDHLDRPARPAPSGSTTARSTASWTSATAARS